MGRKSLSKKRLYNPSVRSRCIEKLMPIYLAEGFKGMKMDVVVGHLGISKATLYKHFATRYEIVEAVVDLKIAEIDAFKFLLLNDSVNFQSRYLEAVKSASIQLAGISNQFLSDLKDMYPHLWSRFNTLFDNAAEIMARFYKRGIKKGIINDMDPSFLATTDKIFLSALADPQFLIDNNLTLQKAVGDFFWMKSVGIFKEKPKNSETDNI